MNPNITIHQGDAHQILKTLPSQSIHCCITSPPYWGLRDYQVAGQIGLESNFTDYLNHLLAAFDQVHRVLRNDGTCWVNLGDLYIPNGSTIYVNPPLKSKDLLGMPWRIALALQERGWYLRSDIIWHKPNPMPESVKDRPTRAHEYLFLLTKSQKYHYDHTAIMEPVTGNAHARGNGKNPKCAGWADGPGSHCAIDHAKPGGSYKCSIPGRNGGPGQNRRSTRPRQNASFSVAVSGLVERRNKRSVWTIAPAPYKGSHYATFPPKLVEPCLLAGCPVGGTVLDPFAGTGTVGQVARQHGRHAILIELNSEYITLIHQRLKLAS